MLDRVQSQKQEIGKNESVLRPNPTDGILLRLGVTIGFFTWLFSQALGLDDRYGLAVFVGVSVGVILIGILVLLAGSLKEPELQTPLVDEPDAYRTERGAVRVTCPNCGSRL